MNHMLETLATNRRLQLLQIQRKRRGLRPQWNMRTLYEYMIIVEGCTERTRKMKVAPPYIHTKLKYIALSWGRLKFEDVCCTDYLWWSLLRFLPKHNVFHVGLCGRHDKHARIADTLSTTVWDILQEHIRKGDRSINAPATSFGVIP